ncbi:MAG: zinc metallopeptidase [Spirochaetes bacterium]|uniref:Zinc metallopeptidase n=1 Tax=Candidatus Avitreponema avistercoris TaxID=2840705 RepID=A0A9D9EPX3_9SPIR|nr:zinc metallopeptidase [Candidatus Avitreponema avistercoris]
MFIDQYYLMLVFPALLLSLAAQFWVSSAFSRWSKVQTSGRISGQDAAHLLLRNAGITDVAVEPVPGRLTDHYSPTEKKLRLSDAVYGAYSVAAVGVAAHETGHAIQHKNGYGPLWLRSVLVPAANIGSTLGPYIVIAGLIFSFPVLIQAGILAFSAAVLFYLVTLPVEFNASARAVAILRQNRVLNEEELRGVKKVLTAAAMTYVASALTAVLSLLRLILLARNSRNR